MTELNSERTQESGIAEDANVLITISTSEADGMIRRWGIVSKAIGELSVEALLRGAVDDRVLDALRSQRPQQYETEGEIATHVKSILGSGYRVFVRESDDPIDSARAPHVAARSLLARGNPEYQTGAFYVLHLTVEPFGAAALATDHDDVDVANASEALRQGLTSSITATTPSTEVPDAGMESAPVMAAAEAESGTVISCVPQVAATTEQQAAHETTSIGFSVVRGGSDPNDCAGASVVNPVAGASGMAPSAPEGVKIELSVPGDDLSTPTLTVGAVTATFEEETDTPADSLAVACPDEPAADPAELGGHVATLIDEGGERDVADASAINAATQASMAVSDAVSPAEAEPPVLSAAGDAVAAAAAAEGLRSERTAFYAAAEITPLTTPDEDTAVSDEDETIEVYVAQGKKRVPKIEALMEQFRPKIAVLDFRGLFAGNFGGHVSTAVDVTKLSALSPQTISAYLMKANALRQAGDFEKALSYYRVLLKSDPDNADYRFLYGKALLEMGRVQQAREYLERARELGHENATYELEKLENRETKKPGLRFFRLLRSADSKR